MRRMNPILAGLAALALASVTLAVDVKVPIKEYEVPWGDSRPRDPVVDAAGQIWFVGQRAHYVARLDPATGRFQKYELEPGTGPHTVVIDRQGMAWYTGNLVASLGRLDPRTGSITKFPMPDPAARDPHTLVFDRNNTGWFTVQGGNFVGRVTPATGEVRLVAVPTPRARPYGIALDSRDRPWFNEFGTNKIGTLDPETLELKEFALPHPDARGRRIAVTSDDRIWYVDYARGFLGRLDPATGEVTEWPAPAGAKSSPYALTVDDRDRLWFVETGVKPNRLVGFDSGKGEIFSVTEIGSGALAVRHMFFHKPTRAIWFGTDANTIGRATVP